MMIRHIHNVRYEVQAAFGFTAVQLFNLAIGRASWHKNGSNALLGLEFQSAQALAEYASLMPASPYRLTDPERSIRHDERKYIDG